MATIILAANTPTLLLNENPKRKRLRLQMLAADLDANNVGRIHIGFGFQPQAVVGNPAAGEILVPSASMDEPPAGAEISPDRKKAIWANSSVANQTMTVEEETENG